MISYMMKCPTELKDITICNLFKRVWDSIQPLTRGQKWTHTTTTQDMLVKLNTPIILQCRFKATSSKIVDSKGNQASSFSSTVVAAITWPWLRIFNLALRRVAIWVDQILSREDIETQETVWRVPPTRVRFKWTITPLRPLVVYKLSLLRLCNPILHIATSLVRVIEAVEAIPESQTKS